MWRTCLPDRESRACRDHAANLWRGRSAVCEWSSYFETVEFPVKLSLTQPPAKLSLKSPISPPDIHWTPCQTWTQFTEFPDKPSLNFPTNFQSLNPRRTFPESPTKLSLNPREFFTESPPNFHWVTHQTFTQFPAKHSLNSPPILHKLWRHHKKSNELMITYLFLFITG